MLVFTSWYQTLSARPCADLATIGRWAKSAPGPSKIQLSCSTSPRTAHRPRFAIDAKAGKPESRSQGKFQGKFQGKLQRSAKLRGTAWERPTFPLPRIAPISWGQPGCQSSKSSLRNTRWLKIEPENPHNQRNTQHGLASGGDCKTQAKDCLQEAPCEPMELYCCNQVVIYWEAALHPN